MPKLLISVDADTKYLYDVMKVSGKDAKAVEEHTGRLYSQFGDAAHITSEADVAIVLAWLATRQAWRDGLADDPGSLADFDVPSVMIAGSVEVIDDPTDETAPGATPDPTTPAPESSAGGKRTGSRTANSKLSAA